ncbi:MAG: PAS domain S-box protein [Deltaproteobacteria bacterium]|nr:PAS domain S-box protein [Deltaproteobacteria bacterium]
MPTTAFDQRPSGIQAAGELPWGSHFCVLYSSARELIEALVPFIRAGLECNELCSWEIREPPSVEEVTRALTEAVPDFGRRAALGQLELVPAPVGEAFERRLDRAILAGFDGLRLVRYADGNWSGRALATRADVFRRLNVVAAVLYPRAGIGAVDLMQVVQDHRFALVCSASGCEVLEGSEARIARDALARSEEKLQSLFRNMSEGFANHRIVLDAEGRPCDYLFLEANAAFERLTGLHADKILGKRVTQVLPGIEKDPTDWIGRYGRVALTGEPVQFESHAEALDRWYAVSAFSPHKGYFAVTFTDITERKQAQDALAAERERLGVTLRSIGDAVVATDTQGRVTLMNRVAEGLTGWSEAEARGRPLGEVFRIIHEVTGEPAEDPVRKVIEQGCIVGLANHTALVARDGRRVAIADSAAPIHAQGGELSGVVLVFRDVTAERQAEEELRTSEARLREADRYKNGFLAALSHELRNPLAPIRNSLFILERAASGGEQAKRAHAVIDRQVAHMGRLIDDLLDVTRVSRGKVQLQREKMELGDLVRRTVEDHRQSFIGAGVKLDSKLSTEAMWLTADATRIAQVVGNLLGNAVKFTPRGGRVELTLEPQGAAALLRIRDSGVGMSQAVVERLFQPFMQAEETLDRSRCGLGLGLALVKGLVEIHGGTVAARSGGPGQGAEFSILLPLEAAPEKAARPQRPQPVSQRRVLVIEDNVDAADSLKEALELMGHEVAVAYDGPAGLAAARELQPEVLLCDVGLPSMDGYEVARAFRADEALKRTFLVALTGHALPEDLQRAAEAGFERHVAKPPALEKLEQLLAAAPQRSSHDGSTATLAPAV